MATLTLEKAYLVDGVGLRRRERERDSSGGCSRLSLVEAEMDKVCAARVW